VVRSLVGDDVAVEDKRNQLRWEAVRFALYHLPWRMAHVPAEAVEQYNHSYGAGQGYGRPLSWIAGDLEGILRALDMGGNRRAQIVADWDAASMDQFKAKVLAIQALGVPVRVPTPQTLEEVLADAEGDVGAEW